MTTASAVRLVSLTGLALLVACGHDNCCEPSAVASVTVAPAAATVLVTDTTRLNATVKDAGGHVLTDRVVTWTSDNPAIATVDANGLVTGVGVGTAAVTATSEVMSDTASIGVQLAVFAFTSNRDGDYEVYLMNADGSAVAALTNNAASDYVGGWSPDGQKIVFQSDRDGNSEIYVMNADGSAPTRLTNNPSFEFHPMWSPDGQKIAFASNRDGNYEIYVMNADGTAQTRLTNSPSVDQYAAWSPDGQKIAFASTRDGNYEIYVMNADGTAQTRLTNNTSSEIAPTWSPDGQKMAFCQDPGSNPDPGIYVMNADGSAQIRLTNDGYEPAWSPDGQKIAFQSYLFVAGFYDDEVYVMNADGTNRTRITNNPAQDILPRWRP
jgi:Tol biopolymer transport system component